ncbi:hypothetical protein PsB1_1984 [Candidatus Phycosocius spiralis]|uniref:Alpha/beta hydrolase n=2 Tax=Candidatus Phycosocius spiralis TaxID=2815099 RepID=A0ABQ4PXL2_9PROT|nr:hypothetical protein PsB1_1984 [Candidatus Phycosocius spiralis]
MDRRAMITTLALTGIGMGLVCPKQSRAYAISKEIPANGGENGLNPLPWLNRENHDSFQSAYDASMGVVPARCADFSMVTPEGIRRSAKIAYPLTLFDRLPFILFCPDQGCTAALYEPIIAAFAASGYFVLAVDDLRAPGQLRQDLADSRKLSQAVARFFIDQAGEAAKILGTRASSVSTARVGVAGHGTGAWTAFGLAGWTPSTGENVSDRDGRVKAAFALSPSPLDDQARVVNDVAGPDGALALIAGQAASLPTVLPGSGILTLTLPNHAANFAGLIGKSSGNDDDKASAPVRRNPRLAKEAAALGASIAAATIFFDWGIKRQNDRKRTLLGLDGRIVEGLGAPLRITRA